MSFAGDLRSMPLEDLLGLLATVGKTGTLVIDGAEFSMKIIIEDSKILATSSTDPRAMLGTWLIACGLISEAELEAAFAMKENRRTLAGELLVQIGLLPAKELDEVLRLKTMESIFDAFTWRRGSFRLLEGQVPNYAFRPMHLEMVPLTLEGARRADELEKLQDRVPSLLHRPKRVGNFDFGAMKPLDLELLPEMNGKRSIEELSRFLRRSSLEVAVWVAQALDRGMVKLLQPDVDDSGRGHTLLRQAEEYLAHNRLLPSWRVLEELEKVPKKTETEQLVMALKMCIEAKVSADVPQEKAILEVVMPIEELLELSYQSEEGMILSRINGHSSVEEVIKDVPGELFIKQLTVIDLLDRGILGIKN